MSFPPHRSRSLVEARTKRHRSGLVQTDDLVHRVSVKGSAALLGADRDHFHWPAHLAVLTRRFGDRVNRESGQLLHTAVALIQTVEQIERVLSDAVDRPAVVAEGRSEVRPAIQVK